MPTGAQGSPGNPLKMQTLIQESRVGLEVWFPAGFSVVLTLGLWPCFE